MELDARFKLDKVIDEKCDCESLRKLYYRNGKLYAGSPFAVVAIAVTDAEGDCDGSVPVSAFKAAEIKSQKIRVFARKVESIRVIGTEFSAPKVGYPDMERDRPNQPCLTIALNPTLLLNAAKALDAAHCIAISIPVDNFIDPYSKMPMILTTGDLPEGSFALLMPYGEGASTRDQNKDVVNYCFGQKDDEGVEG